LVPLDSLDRFHRDIGANSMDSDKPDQQIPIAISATMLSRIDAALKDGEILNAFVLEAVKGELEKRERAVGI
jgi:hypothetical protein